MSTIFQKIINREVPAAIIFETEDILAFKDINPQAPIHILIIPKKEFKNISYADPADHETLGNLLLAAKQIAIELDLVESGYRLVINNGSDAGQEVDHLHIHLLAGRKLNWPPG